MGFVETFGLQQKMAKRGQEIDAGILKIGRFQSGERPGDIAIQVVGDHLSKSDDRGVCRLPPGLLNRCVFLSASDFVSHKTSLKISDCSIFPFTA